MSKPKPSALQVINKYRATHTVEETRNQFRSELLKVRAELIAQAKHPDPAVRAVVCSELMHPLLQDLV